MDSKQTFRFKHGEKWRFVDLDLVGQGIWWIWRGVWKRWLMVDDLEKLVRKR